MKGKTDVPPDHPRAESLRIREILVTFYRLGIIVPEGLIAHGRGEAFDYLLDEKTIEPTYRAIKVAGVALLLAKHPVISVNGNSTALVAKELVELAKLTRSKIEVNLFYRSYEREIAIKNVLMNFGAEEVLGVGEKASARIAELSSERRKVDVNGIYSADVVLVPLEDGDRTEALRKMGKSVIAIDLNPLSRTARYASITIVDNIIRAIPLLKKEVQKLKIKGKRELRNIIRRFDNEKNLLEYYEYIAKRLTEIKGRGELYP